METPETPTPTDPQPAPTPDPGAPGPGGPAEPQPVEGAGNLGALVSAVTERTQGTAGDPLSRGEVEQVVRATLDELGIALPG